MQALFSFRLLTTTQLFQRGQIFQVSSKKLLSLFFHLSYFKNLAHFLRGHFLIFRYLALTRPALLYCTTSKICWANNRELRSMKLSYIQLPHQANKQIFFVAAAAAARSQVTDLWQKNEGKGAQLNKKYFFRSRRRFSI